MAALLAVAMVALVTQLAGEASAVVYEVALPSQPISRCNVCLGGQKRPHLLGGTMQLVPAIFSAGGEAWIIREGLGFAHHCVIWSWSPEQVVRPFLAPAVLSGSAALGQMLRHPLVALAGGCRPRGRRCHSPQNHAARHVQGDQCVKSAFSEGHDTEANYKGRREGG